MTRGLRLTVFALIAAATALLASPTADALLAKHECGFCHGLTHGDGTVPFVPQYSPTNMEVLCLGCHLTAIDGSDPDTIETPPIQPHRTGETGNPPAYGSYYVTCFNCHAIHDNMPNWRAGHTDPENSGLPPPDGWTEGTNAKMVGREDPDGETPYAMILTREADFDKNGIPDRAAAVPTNCDPNILNDCFVQGKRHVIFENFDPDTSGEIKHAFADRDDDGVDDTTAIGVASNVSDSGFNMSPFDSICQMCHSQTANHNLPGGSGETHNAARRCTACHEHGFCFDRGNSCAKWSVPNRDLRVDLVSALPTTISPGGTTTITVDVTNLGDKVETFRVNYTSDIEGGLGVTTVSDLAPGASGQTFFNWTANAVGSHTVEARAENLIDETQTANNSGTTLVTVGVLTLVKTATPSTYTAVNDPIDYDYLVTNVGAVPLAGPVTVADDKITVSCPNLSTVGNGDGNLDPTEQITCTVTYTITAADITAGSVTNTATASVGGETSGPDTATVELETAALSLVKTATPTEFSLAGEVIDYSFLVTNTGNVPLAGPVTVADDQATDEACPAVSTVGNNDAVFDPTEQITCTASYTITAADVTAGSVTNIATASADGVNSNSDTVTVNWVALPEADVSVAITNVGGNCQADCVRLVQVTVDNAGPDATLGAVTVTLSVQYDGTSTIDTIDTLTTSGSLASGANEILNFNWNITGTTPAGRHDLTAVTVPLDLGGQDPDTADNTDTQRASRVN